MSFGMSAVAQAMLSAILLMAVLALYLYRFAPSKRWLVVVTGVCLLDQYLKLFVLSRFHGHAVRLLDGHLNIVYLQNYEQGFGGSVTSLLFCTLICVLALVFLYDRLTKTAYRMSTLAEIGFALLIGGCAGILLDRIARGFVVDFLDFGPRTDFVYNLGDLAVIAAAALLVVRAVRYLTEPRDWRKALRKKSARDRRRGTGETRRPRVGRRRCAT